MRKRQFSDEERYAVYTVHGEKCYMCFEPLDLMTMEVDHVIPETLLGDSTRLAEVLCSYGLSPSFDLQSFANWLPACGPCNNKKRSSVFNPTPLSQLALQIAQEKAPKAMELSRSRVSAQTVSKAWNTIKRAMAAGEVNESIRSAIDEFAAFHAPKREPEVVAQPIRLTPLIVVRGPYGAGGGPIGPDIDSSFRCPTCGSVAWNGVRCVVCGEMSDD